jgi:peptidyl-prolyl cis-trans isomerase A (cyclophilin A)
MSQSVIRRRTVLGAVGLAAAAPVGVLAAAGKPRVAILSAKGTIVVELETRKAPITANNFLRYVEAGAYDTGANIYRASRTKGEPPGHGTIQGQPRGDFRRFPGIAHEPTTKTGLKHVAGTISLGRYAPGTATADFFICASPQPYYDADPDRTDGDKLGYPAFGQVVQGMDVVMKILALETKGKAAFPELKGQILTVPIPITMKRLA